MKKIYIEPIMTKEEAAAMVGTTLKDEHCKKVYREDVDVYDKDTKACLARFRVGIIPTALIPQAYEALKNAATKNDARVSATAGALENSGTGKVTQYRVRKNGTLSKQVAVPKELMINSGIIGYYGRTVRFPYCRQTAFTEHNFQKFKKAYPLIKFIDLKYKELMPEEYEKQKAAVENSSQDFIIKGTAFSTVTVNKNYQTSVHTDSGDFMEGFGNLAALRDGTFEGCYFTLVQYGVGFDMQNGDLLMVDVHREHGNTPMKFIDPKAVRLSLVCYFREDIQECGTLEQELKRVQKRKQGQPLKGKV